MTRGGFKKTVPCRAPRAILADLDVLAAAPPEMSAWGYGDLAGKVPAGGDWIIADALGAEAIDDVAWPLVQDNLAGWLAAPDAVRAGDAAAMADLFAGLTLSGLAMEFYGTSRPASGADHQIAHMWEMESLAFGGERVSHGACVAVGAMASQRLFDWVLSQDLTGIDVDALVEKAPTLAVKQTEIERSMAAEIVPQAMGEVAAKHLEGAELRARLERLRSAWPSLSARLTSHMMRAPRLAELLRAAGAPVFPEDIGLDDGRLVETVRVARFVRARYTILDLLEECGLLDLALDSALARHERSGER